MEKKHMFPHKNLGFDQLLSSFHAFGTYIMIEYSDKLHV